MDIKNFEKAVEKARKTVLIRLPFFSTLIQTVNTYLIRDDDECYKHLPYKTAFTDGAHIYFFEQEVRSSEQDVFTATWIHEMLHIAFSHNNRAKLLKKQFNPLKWNHACDYAINLIIDEVSKNFNNREFPIRIDDNFLIDEKYKGMSSEQIYKELPNGKFPYVELVVDGDGNISVKYSNDADEQQIKDALKHASDLVIKTQKNDKETERNKKRSEKNAANIKIFNEMNNQGNIPSGIIREIEELLKPKIKWSKLLENFLHSFPNDYDYMKRDRRFTHSDIVFPSFDGNKVKIAIGIDTSGSISEKDLKEFLTEIYGITKQFDAYELLLIDCDADVQGEVVRITSEEQFLNWKPKGGGGTDFRPVFEWVEHNEPDIEGLIYFTDGYGDFPDSTRLKTLWVINSGYPEDKIPFGKVIYYNQNEFVENNF